MNSLYQACLETIETLRELAPSPETPEGRLFQNLVAATVEYEVAIKKETEDK